MTLDLSLAYIRLVPGLLCFFWSKPLNDSFRCDISVLIGSYIQLMVWVMAQVKTPIMAL